MRLIVYSLAIVTVISLGIGFITQDFFGGSTAGFLRGFTGSVIAQFLIFYFSAVKTEKKEEINDSQIKLDEIIAQQTCPISCPCGKNVITAPIFINQDNAFECEVCKSKFRVEVSYESILLTEQVNLNNIFNILKEKEQ